MTIALDVMKLALGEIRVLKPGETPAPEESDDFILRLNAALESWAAEGLLIPYLTEDTRALTAGVASITIGTVTPGTWTTARPVRVIRAYVRDASGNDTPVEIITRDRWDALVDKTPSNGIPEYLFYDATFPDGTVYLYPPDDGTRTLHLISEKQFTAFTDTNSSFSFPPGYLEFMGYNMAVRLAGPYNKALSPSTIALAQSTKRNIEDMNAAKSPIRGVVNVPAGNSGGFNILTGA